jgi:hypothetical protein
MITRASTVLSDSRLTKSRLVGIVVDTELELADTAGYLLLVARPGGARSKAPPPTSAAHSCKRRPSRSRARTSSQRS